ncbi:hypothetical protein ACCO45_006843 [Purpureocillium lilacinum]|uniref:Uncharacterized protein n=1 Tax=Purpureocillium lilacinum TaxID=33203 RepID=A0ACC4DQM1_PURLI
MGRGDARQTFTRIPAPSAQMDARDPRPLSTRDDVDFPRLAGLAWPWQQHMGGQGRPVERCASSSVSKRERRHPHLGGVCNAFVEPRSGREGEATLAGATVWAQQQVSAARSRAVEGSRGYFSRVMGRQLRRCRADVIHAKGWRKRRRRFSPMAWSVVRLRRATAKGPARSSADGGPP